MESLWEATGARRAETDSSRNTAAATGTTTADVAIVGGGYTGMWTARYLADADPSLRIVLVEAHRLAFGASSRNGGWCSALFPTGHARLAERHGVAAAEAMRDAMRATVDEVGRAADEDGIDCQFAKGGTLIMATNPAHLERVRDHLEDGEEWLDADAARARVDASGLLGAAITPHCAAIHPARLSSGLARAVLDREVIVHEHSPVTAIEPGRVICANGAEVRADHVLRCTEGYTSTLRGERRSIVPIYSLMIATEPLPESVWDSIGLRDRETFSDGRHLLIYGQRTADGRFAFGGRGAPYHFGSAVKPEFDGDPRVFAELERTLRALFPQIGNATVTHRWGGALGVPRDWMASVGVDASTGVGWAGGYVGDGVSTSNLAGRTLCDLVLGRETALTALPWVNHRSRTWEPEPLRWMGINVGRAVAGVADRSEARTQRPARQLERAMGWFTGS